MEIFLFYLLSSITIGCSLLTVFSKNSMYSVLYVIASFFAVAGLYLMLNAEFLAIVHIIVYAGAIMVLFLFVVMFLNINSPVLIRKDYKVRLAAMISGGLFALTLLAALRKSALPVSAEGVTSEVGTVKTLGKLLFTEFLLPFELSSVLFISAMVGIIILTKKEE